MGLRNFERALERMVEGAFARAFQTSVRPIELGRRLTREMDEHRTIGVRGQEVAPNSFTVSLCEPDYADLADVRDTLARQLEEAAREHARDEGYAFMGPVEVEITVSPKLRAGRFELEGRLREGPGGGAGSLVLADGRRVRLGDEPATIGRLPDCAISLSDPNSSRTHAEVRRHADGWMVVDLNSTNGTKVNGSPIRERVLQDGDEITVGNTEIRFEES
jgi:hypothetical protein